MTASKPSLLVRAQAIARSRAATGSALAIATLAAAAEVQAVVGPNPGSITSVSAGSTGGSGGGSYGFVSGAGPYVGNGGAFNLVSSSGTAIVGGTPTPVIKLSGSLDFNNNFNLQNFYVPFTTFFITITGTLPDANSSGSPYLGFNFTPTFTAGTGLMLNSIDFTTQAGTTSIGSAPLTSGALQSFSLLGGNQAGFANRNFSATLRFDWQGTNFSSSTTQTLHIDIPGTSLDFGIAAPSAVPEPATVAAGLCAAVLASWTIVSRRRRPTIELR